MPLSRNQFKACCDLLSPQFNIPPDERSAFVTTALYGSPVLDKITWTGSASVFTTNLVRTVDGEDNESHDLVIDLLMILRDSVDETKITAIDALIATLAPTEPSILAPTILSKTATPRPHGVHIFISYSRRDRDFVDRLRADLRTRKIPYWIDKEGLTPGTRNWEKALRRAIENSYAVVWVVSPDSLESEYVQDEIALAEVEQSTLFPVWATGNIWQKCVPLGKGHYQHIDMRSDNYPIGFDQLVTALNGQAPELAAPIPEVPTLTPGQQRENPYMGLSAFNEQDTNKFFGRDALIAQLAERLGHQLDAGDDRFLAVLGPSGAGKSSVVMAGLIPALKGGALPGSSGWTYLPRMVPGTHPVEHLADVLAPVLRQPLSHIETDLNAPGGRMLHRLAQQLPGERAVLYIDQFEETFTLAADGGERLQFINLLTEASTEPKGKLLVLLSMRADFLDHPLNYPQLGKLFNRYNELVQPMAIHELRDAIEKPAHLPTAGLTFDAGLVAEIIFALRGRDKALAGALPLLQFTLERLYEERDDNRLTWDAYDRMGGVSGAIGSHSEAVFAGLPPDAQAQLPTVFLPLVNIDEETGEPTRRRATIDAVAMNVDAKRLMTALINNRLLQTGRDGDTVYVEVTHEALLRSWTRLVDWIMTTRDDLRLLRQVEREAVDWDAGGREYLLTAERLKPIHTAVARLGYDLTAVTHDFIYPQASLLRELENPNTDEKRRLRIGDDLDLLGDPREGIGVADGVPDMTWLPVEVSPDAVTIKTDENKIGPLVIPPFFIAKYQVTYPQYQAFVKADDGFKDDRWWEGMPGEYKKQPLSDQRTVATNNPRDSISWYQSVAFARWMNHRCSGLALLRPNGETLIVGDNAEIRLPTEWEWQWAAQGGSKEYRYPWGDWQRGMANTSESGLGRAIAVGMYPLGKATCGALDMAGNLFEWCLNDHKALNNINGYNNDESKVLRGGSFDLARNLAAAVSRNGNSPSSGLNFDGFRLVVVLRSP